MFFISSSRYCTYGIICTTNFIHVVEAAVQIIAISVILLTLLILLCCLLTWIALRYCMSR